MTIPASVQELTPAWFSAALDVRVESTEILDSHSGTTGRALVRLSGDSALPPTVFVKLQPFAPDQREFLRAIGLGVAEAQLYTAVGDELPVRVPRVLHTAFDEQAGEFIMVLEDLTASSCRFPNPDDADVLAVATSLMDELAALHAAYWGRDLDWLSRHAMSSPRNTDRAKRSANAASIIASAVDQFSDDLPAEFRQMGELYVERAIDIMGLYGEGERTLIHGDNHIGNLFVDEGRTGFYDWAVASCYPGMRDVAYFLCNSLPTEVRRAEEAALISRYRTGLAARGITLDEDVALQQYRLFAVYSWSSASMTAAMGSKWQPAEVGWSATIRTTQALIDLDVLSLLHERLTNK